jgi:predicted amidohydrolase YtcJ
MKNADLILAHGPVCVDGTTPGPAVDAVAVRDGVILAIGRAADILTLKGPRTELIDLRGRLLLPAFGDAHAHASAATAELYSAQLFGLTSVRDCTAAVGAFAACHPDLQIVRGEGWANTIAPRLGPRREDLDAVVPDRPAALWSEDYHSLWVNSRALALAGISRTTDDPPGGVIERLPDGEPAGTLRECAMDLVAGLLPDYDKEQYRRGILHYQQDIAAPAGITAVFDPLLPAPGRSPADTPALRAYARLAAAGELTLRARLGLTMTPQDDPVMWTAQAAAAREALAAAVATRNDPRTGDGVRHPAAPVAVTAAKFFADGVIEGHTAYLLEDYADAPGDRGMPLWEPGELAAAFATVHTAGLQIHVHCIGDAATAETLDALEETRRQSGSADWRPVITHVQLAAPADIRRCARLEVIAALQPFWFVLGDYFHDLEVPYLGERRATAEYPFGSFLDAGAVVAGASDFPVTKPCDPLVGIQAGVMRWLPNQSSGDTVLGPAERGSLEQLITAFTSGAAYAHRLEAVTGTIAAGMSADLVVVDRDLFAVPPAEIGRARVELTLFEGRPVHAGPSL